jgi:hypothetical protein
VLGKRRSAEVIEKNRQRALERRSSKRMRLFEERMLSMQGQMMEMQKELITTRQEMVKLLRQNQHAHRLLHEYLTRLPGHAAKTEASPPGLTVRQILTHMNATSVLKYEGALREIGRAVVASYIMYYGTPPPKRISGDFGVNVYDMNDPVTAEFIRETIRSVCVEHGWE